MTQNCPKCRVDERLKEELKSIEQAYKSNAFPKHEYERLVKQAKQSAERAKQTGRNFW